MIHQGDIEKLIDYNQRRLQKLKEQEALEGISVDPKVSLEIENIEAKIEQLQIEVTGQRESPSSKTKDINDATEEQFDEVSIEKIPKHRLNMTEIRTMMQIINNLRPRFLSNKVDLEFVDVEDDRVYIHIFNVDHSLSNTIIQDEARRNITLSFMANGCYLNLVDEQNGIFVVESRHSCLRCPLARRRRAKICQFCSHISYLKASIRYSF